MVTPKGFTIPMVLAIGNHEVRGGSGNSPTNAVFYSRYFAGTRTQLLLPQIGKKLS